MEERYRFFTMVASLVAVICALLAPKAYAITPQQQARSILETVGIKGGLIVHIGCGDGELTAALGADESYLVHGLDPDPLDIENARQHIKNLGLYGRITADHWDKHNLPYIENLVNLVVSENLGGVSINEVMRVLCPAGVAYIRTGATWTKMVKPRPNEIDEWTHYLYDASNNAVAHDMVVGPPRRFQWVGSPRWSRHHDRMASMSACVSANGRIFYIMDEGTRLSLQLPSKWVLIARDAFNGTVLWKRPIASWVTQLWPFKSGPALLPRRLVAVGDRVYVTLGLDNTCLSTLDAATGETIRTHPDTSMSEEIVFSEGVLFAVIKDTPPTTTWNEYKTIHRWLQDAKGRVASEWPWDEGNRRIMAIQSQTGDVLWQSQYRAAPMTLAANANGVYFHNGDRVICLDRDNGDELWQSVSVARRNPMPPYFGPTLVVYNDVVLFEGGNSGRTLTALSTKDGRTLWADSHPNTGHYCPYDLLVVGGLAWVGAIANTSQSGTFTGWDPHTGAKSQFDLDVSAPWMHHRCYRAKATDRYILTSRMGIEFVDPAAQQHWTIHHWVRGGCLYGVMPCNGLIYAPPHDCACYYQSKLFGFCALAAEHTDPQYPQSPPEEERLEQGPAYGEPDSTPPGAEDWPTYRHDPARSGYIRSIVPADLRPLWQTQLEGTLTSPVIANSRIYVASVDMHTVYALDEDSGNVLWSFHAGGRVDSPPTIYNARVIFGCADGWVYCLRASDGRLAWRFQAAPQDLRMTAFEQVESVWPVSGSVLVLNDTVYCVAGRSMFLDGGLRLLLLDPITGSRISEHILDERDPDTGQNLQERSQGKKMPVALPDILSSDGKYLYMRSQRFDLEGYRTKIAPESETDQKGEGIHLFCPTGFLDDTWFHRSYWIFGKNAGEGYSQYYVPGRLVPSGRILAFNDSCVYGFGRQQQYYIHTVPLEYHLFAAEKFPASDSVEYHWTNNSVPLLVRAMVLADKMLFIAGPPDLVDEEEAFDYWSADADDPSTDPNIPVKLNEQDAALKGQRGALLWAVNTTDGNSVAQYNLESPPVWDGMVAANGRLYLSVNNGKVQCFVGVNYSPVVNAGEDQSIYPMAIAALDATITDDGFPKVDPCDPSSVPIGITTNWAKLYGPGEVIFGDPCGVDTTASFSQWGKYTLRLNAFDGRASCSDDVNVFVCRPGDMDFDNDVDLFDLDTLLAQWLYGECNALNDWCGGADQTAEGSVGLGDYTIISSNWLQGVHPPAPTNLVARPGDGQISLEWDDNSEADIAGYHVYRSVTAGYGYKRVNESLLADSQYVDTNVTNCIAYYYVVVAEDKFGYKSTYSREVCTSAGAQPVMRLIASTGAITYRANVSNWEDQAKNNDARQDTVEDRPILVDSAINGQPAIDFDGAGDHLDVADSDDINLAGPYSGKTLAVVFKTGHDVITRQVIWEQGGSTRGLNFYLDSNNLYIGGWNLGQDEMQWGPTGLSTPVSANSVYLAILVMDGDSGGFEGFVNAKRIGGARGIDLLHSHSDDCAFGHVEGTTKFHDGSTAGPASFAGLIAEFHQYNEALSSKNRETLQAILISQYGIGSD